MSRNLGRAALQAMRALSPPPAPAAEVEVLRKALEEAASALDSAGFHLETRGSLDASSDAYDTRDQARAALQAARAGAGAGRNENPTPEAVPNENRTVVTISGAPPVRPTAAEVAARMDAILAEQMEQAKRDGRTLPDMAAVDAEARQRYRAEIDRLNGTVRPMASYTDAAGYKPPCPHTAKPAPPVPETAVEAARGGYAAHIASVRRGTISEITRDAMRAALEAARPYLAPEPPAPPAPEEASADE